MFSVIHHFSLLCYKILQAKRKHPRARRLWLLTDGASDNWNFSVTAFAGICLNAVLMSHLAFLVGLGLFDEVAFYRLPPGHSHSINDQSFSQALSATAGKNVFSVACALHLVLQRMEKKPPMLCWLGNGGLYDFDSFFTPFRAVWSGIRSVFVWRVIGQHVDGRRVPRLQFKETAQAPDWLGLNDEVDGIGVQIFVNDQLPVGQAEVIPIVNNDHSELVRDMREISAHIQDPLSLDWLQRYIDSGCNTPLDDVLVRVPKHNYSHHNRKRAEGLEGTPKFIQCGDYAVEVHLLNSSPFDLFNNLSYRVKPVNLSESSEGRKFSHPVAAISQGKSRHRKRDVVNDGAPPSAVQHRKLKVSSSGGADVADAKHDDSEIPPPPEPAAPPEVKRRRLKLRSAVSGAGDDAGCAAAAAAERAAEDGAAAGVEHCNRPPSRTRKKSSSRAEDDGCSDPDDDDYVRSQSIVALSRSKRVQNRLMGLKL